jgi:UDP-glucose 4-epimerase
MRVVLVGATGNVGSALVELLSGDPRVEAVVGIARRAPSWRPPKSRWVEADIARDDLSRHLEGADAVVHLAWSFQPTRDAVRTWRTNVLGSLRLFFTVARSEATALVYASSVGAYAPAPQDAAVDESWPTHALPTAAYGREKSYLERVLDTFERDHPALRVVRMRPAFIFQRASAAEQRRLFLGPFVPGRLADPGRVPVVPDLPGLRFQALHARDAAEAYQRVLFSDVAGAFNLAAEPVIDAAVLAELLDARVVRVPPSLARTSLAAAWRLRLVPATPGLLDLALSLPTMDSGRARRELGWEPVHTSTAALGEFLAGLREGAGGPTPTLRSRAGGPARWREVATGVGARDRLG